MKNIIDVINSMEDVICGKGVKENDIEKSEIELDLKFADDYRYYAKHFGCMSIGSREFTGISKLANYSVVTITIAQKQYNQNIPKDWYVIEQLNIDGIVIWQSSTGEIYQTSPNSDPVKICDSMAEYLSIE